MFWDSLVNEHNLYIYIYREKVKGIVNVIWSGSQFKDDNARFTSVLLFKYEFCFFKLYIFIYSISAKVTSAFLAFNVEIIRIK